MVIRLTKKRCGGMNVTEKLIRSIMLNNGLKLKIYDTSKMVAGDRWHVRMDAIIDIPLNDALFSLNTESLEDTASFNKYFGEKLCYEQKRERNFINSKLKDKLLESLIDLFLQTKLEYLSNPNFPKKYLLRQYEEFIRRKPWSYH
jgi:hypothetical protein